jgi:hypothetical protein
VAKGKVLNHSAPIQTTTIFTPTQTGLYRLSVHGSITTAAPGSTSYYYYNLSWTDASGALQTYGGLITSIDSELGQWVNGYPANYPITFQAVAGTPVTHSVLLSGSPDTAVYSVYYAIERRE